MPKPEEGQELQSPEKLTEEIFMLLTRMQKNLAGDARISPSEITDFHSPRANSSLWIWPPSKEEDPNQPRHIYFNSGHANHSEVPGYIEGHSIQLHVAPNGRRSLNIYDALTLPGDAGPGLDMMAPRQMPTQEEATTMLRDLRLIIEDNNLPSDNQEKSN